MYGLFVFENRLQKFSYLLKMICYIPIAFIKGGITEVIDEIDNYTWLCKNSKEIIPPEENE